MREQVRSGRVLGDMKKIFSLLAAVATFALPFGGCVSVTPAERASLSLAGLDSASSSIFETTLELTLHVTNESAQPLRLTGSSHKLTLNGSMIGSGVSNVALEVPPLATATTVRLQGGDVRGVSPDGVLCVRGWAER